MKFFSRFSALYRRTGIERAVTGSGTVGNEEFSIKTKSWHLIADAFFGVGRRCFDCLTKFLQCLPLF